MRTFVDAIAADEHFEPGALKVRMGREEAFARLAAAYRL
jgi:hypothetical protein